MTRDKLSVCLGLFIQRLNPRVRELENVLTLVNRRLWKINNQISNQFPQFEWIIEFRNPSWIRFKSRRSEHR